MSKKVTAELLVKACAEAGFHVTLETAMSFVQAAVVEAHLAPVVDVDCSCELCEYVEDDG